MPSYGRWRHIKIVAQQSRAQEISAGIRNALDRGESRLKAKQSFINAGYSPEEVQAASQMVRASPLRSKPLSQEVSSENYANVENSTSKKTIIILSILGAAIIIIGLILGLFWGEIFG